jgi:hypothetical protein
MCLLHQYAEDSTKHSPHPTDFSSMSDNQRIIHLTEVFALDFPTANNYKYKCRLQVLSPEGQTLLERELLNRTQPSWLVDLKNKGDCTIAITLRYREGDITHPWQDAGTVSFATQDCLNGERSAGLGDDLLPVRLKIPASASQTGDSSKMGMPWS